MPDDRIVRSPARHDRAVPRGPALIILLVVLALILAVGFFYMTEVRRDRQAEQVTEAAGKLDGAADRLGDAARDAAKRFDSR